MAEQIKKLGWRKLAAWFIVQGVATYLAIILVQKPEVKDIPPMVADLMKFNVGFFFGANVVKHGLDTAQKVFGKVEVKSIA